MIHLHGLTPAAEEGWWLLFDLGKVDSESWVLFGGQMMQVLGAEHGVAEMVRPTDDVDVVVDVRMRPRGTEWFAVWLRERGFVFEGANADGVGHRFVREVAGGRGRTIFDVLAPEGLGDSTSTYTVPPARTVQTPGAVQAFRRSELVTVSVSGVTGRADRSGLVRRPDLLGALVAKAAATAIAVRENPDRDWQDAALLLATIPDPVSAGDLCDKKDRQRLRLLTPLEDRDHVGWAHLDDEAYRRGNATLAFLLGA